MANWDRQFSNGSYYNNWYGRLVYNVTSQEAGNNRSYVEFYLQAFSSDGAYNQSGSWDARIYVNGAQYARSTPSVYVSSGAVTLTSWGGWMGHDVNGNLYIEPGDYINAPTNEMTQSAIGWTLPRIGLAPANNDPTATSVKPTTATINGSVINHGHGTSSTIYLRYRVSGGAWVELSAGATKAVTGLKPGKTYEMGMRSVNNNGDTSGWTAGTYTFKTKPVAGMVPLLMALL